MSDNNKDLGLNHHELTQLKIQSNALIKYYRKNFHGLETPVNRMDAGDLKCILSTLGHLGFSIVRDSNVMPEALTAENGAKSLLMGDFFETIAVVNPDADSFLNTGEPEFISQKVPISWVNIKEIYKKIRTHFVK